MSRWQRFQMWLFGTQYVLMIDNQGNRYIREAYMLGDLMYAHPHLPETRCELLPNGKFDDPHPPYMEEWKPITPKTVELYNS